LGKAESGTFTEKLLLAAFGLALLIIAAVGILSYLSTKHLIDTGAWVGDTQEALDQVDALLEDTLEVESAARGFVMTGQDFYLEPYFAAKQRINQTFKGLLEMTKGDPELQSRALALRAPLEEKLAYHQHQLEARSKAASEKAVVALVTGRGHQLMDQIRGIGETIKAEEKELLSQRETEARIAARRSVYLLLIGSILSFVILVAIYYHLHGEIARRKKTEANLLRLNRLHVVLSRVSEAVAQGQDRNVLLKQVCQVAVEKGSFESAWIGLLRKDGETLEPAEHWGKHEDLPGRICAAVTHRSGSGAALGRELQLGRSYVCNDSRNDISLTGDGAGGSMAIFPLRISNNLVGALGLHAGQPRYFDGETVSLLENVASDLALALEAIEVEEKRRLVEEKIRKLNEDLERRVLERTEELALANAELALRNREVERANRLKSEFLANMSHELRTPLNAVIGFSDLLAEEKAGPLLQKQVRFVGHIRSGARHLLQLINDILDISKIEAGRVELSRECFRVTEATAEVLSLVRPLAISKGMKVECRIDAGYEIYADRIRFKQILYNLLSNAVKFTPEHGTIRIESYRKEDGSYRFSVSDNGVGIPSDELEAVFEEFHQVGVTAQGIKEGTGLGLAITRRLVELHGGKIWATSRRGEGSTFIFTLPGIASPAAVEPLPDSLLNEG
jgi:signal transduction histidine kinase/CHASE3 domain sensor protein